MALFSRRKKSVDTQDAGLPVDQEHAEDAADQSVAEPEASIEPAPSVGISVQAFRGVGAEAGPEMSLPAEPSQVEPPRAAKRTSSASAGPAAVPATPAAAPRLPLAPALPPEQTHSVDGLDDNVLLREALAQLEDGATNEQLLGVMRQSLQGHLYLRVHGDAREQLTAGKPLSVGVIRDGDRSFMLAYTSGAALRASVQGEEDAAATSAIAQPVASVYRQVVSGGFTGIIIDNSSAPHRAVFPTELLQRALEQGDDDTQLKSLLAAPRDETTPARVAEVLAKKRTWVAVNDGGSGQPIGIAEARSADGRRFLQVFSHPLEVVVLGRKDKPMPFPPEQLGKVLSQHPDIAGVLIDVAGPSLAVERDALAPVMVLAVDLDAE
ncbi:SseB family protein [Microbacterium sp.]|uniref:SseB family protein n=1 Tax=Microbacterium sp. TaxID=51671 RepID=UPI0028118DCF|nr:SseB family protein [Microbacterium sp.]